MYLTSLNPFKTLSSWSVPILQVERLRFRELKTFLQGHIARKWGSWDLTS